MITSSPESLIPRFGFAVVADVNHENEVAVSMLPTGIGGRIHPAVGSEEYRGLPPGQYRVGKMMAGAG